MRAFLIAVNPNRIAKEEVPNFSIKACYENIRNYMISASVAGIAVKFGPNAKPLAQILLIIAIIISVILAIYNLFQSYRLSTILFSSNKARIEQKCFTARALIFIFTFILSASVVYSILAVFILAIASAAK